MGDGWGGRSIGVLAHPCAVFVFFSLFLLFLVFLPFLAADVTWEQREEFCRLSIETRLHECDLQVRALRKGLNRVVPANMLSLFSAYDLELLICGNPVIDLDVLRKHTIYQGLAPGSPLVKYFWQTLESFTQAERQLFLRFVWGRSRLPVSESDWTQQFTLQPLRADGDVLPVAHTCVRSLPSHSPSCLFRCTFADVANVALSACLRCSCCSS
jgi:hypothetical protein